MGSAIQIVTNAYLGIQCVFGRRHSCGDWASDPIIPCCWCREEGGRRGGWTGLCLHQHVASLALCAPLGGRVSQLIKVPSQGLPWMEALVSRSKLPGAGAYHMIPELGAQISWSEPPATEVHHAFPWLGALVSRSELPCNNFATYCLVYHATY